MLSWLCACCAALPRQCPRGRWRTGERCGPLARALLRAMRTGASLTSDRVLGRLSQHKLRDVRLIARAEVDSLQRHHQAVAEAAAAAAVKEALERSAAQVSRQPALSATAETNVLLVHCCLCALALRRPPCCDADATQPGKCEALLQLALVVVPGALAVDVGQGCSSCAHGRHLVWMRALTRAPTCCAWLQLCARTCVGACIHTAPEGHVWQMGAGGRRR